MNLSFLCIMAYVKFFEEKCFVCSLSLSLFPCRKKKSLLSVEVIQNLLLLVSFYGFVLLVSFPKFLKSFSSLFFLFFFFSKLLSWEKPKSMHFSGSCKRDVCLFDNTSTKNLSLDGNLKSTKNAGFPISTTDCTYAFCTSGIFYTGD